MTILTANAKLSGFAGWSAAEPRKIRLSVGLWCRISLFHRVLIVKDQKRFVPI